MKHADFIALAYELGCESAAIQAVAAVESAGGGFLPDGRPKILFEAHIFSQKTGGRFDQSHPHLSSPFWNRALYKGGVAEWPRLNEACQLDRRAALQSASYGAFQIMGFNYVQAGYSSPEVMFDAMKTETGQLQAFCRFIKGSTPLWRALKAKDWASFARWYNGTGQVPAYSANISAAYQRFLNDADPDIDGSVSRETAFEVPIPTADRTVEAKPIWRSETAVGGAMVAAGSAAGAIDKGAAIVQKIELADRGASAAAGATSTLAKLSGALLSGQGLAVAVAILVAGLAAYLVYRYWRKVKNGEAVITGAL